MREICAVILFLFMTTWVVAQCDENRHNTSLNASWISCETAMSPNMLREDSHWIMYDIGRAVQLGQISIWNLNNPVSIENGISSATIDISMDGINWEEWGDFDLERANASGFYTGKIGPDLTGAEGRYVLITATDNHGGDCYGLSEIKIDINGEVPTITEQIGKMILSPNPSSDLTTLSFESLIAHTVNINTVDLSGRLIERFSYSAKRGVNTFEIDVKDYVSGSYIVHIQSSEKNISKQLIVVQQD